MFSKQTNMDKFKIASHLIENNSYFKWSTERLADKYNCSEKKISNIVNLLDPIKQQYLRNLKK